MAAAVLALAWIGSCGHTTLPRSRLTGVGRDMGMTLSVLKDTRYTGLSALAVDDEGVTWALPEQQRVLLRLRREGYALRVDGQPIPIEGIDAAVDTESLAWVGNDTFVVGTEAEDERVTDALLWVHVRNGRGRVVRQEPLPYALWNVHATDNHGIEGLCHVAGELLVAVETVVTVDGSRCAPTARYDIAKGRWQSGRAVLTTGTGKVSAFACRELDAESFEAVAVERHFGVTHVWRYVIPRRWGTAAATAPARPERLLDLSRALNPLPNFEGIAWQDTERLLLVSDNHYGGVTGPTYGLTLTLP